MTPLNIKAIYPVIDRRFNDLETDGGTLSRLWRESEQAEANALRAHGIPAEHWQPITLTRYDADDTARIRRDVQHVARHLRKRGISDAIIIVHNFAVSAHTRHQ